MANKAVVGAVALGVCGYTALERLKDWEVEKEREERQQAIRDERAEYIRRHEESLRKRGNRSNTRNNMGGIENIIMDKLFQAQVYSIIEEKLYHLAVRVGEEGKPYLRGENNLQQLNLPLMSNEVSVYRCDDAVLCMCICISILCTY